MTTSPPAQSQDHQPGDEFEMNPPPEYMPRFDGSGRLKDKVAIITGGDSGIGRAVSVLFARERAKLAILYKDEDRDAEATKALVEKEGGEALLLSGDIGEQEWCEKAVRQTIDRFGAIDILINNAAEQHSCEDPADIPEEQILRTFRTNIFGQFFMTQAVLPHLQEGAAIVCTTSVTAYRGQDILIDYAATKGAILSFVRAMSSRLADRKIRVNGVAPGPIWTPLIPASFDADKVEEFGCDTPLGRPGQPNEVAPAFLFLACEDSSYISGQIIHPNGGELIGG